MSLSPPSRIVPTLHESLGNAMIAGSVAIAASATVLKVGHLVNDPDLARASLVIGTGAGLYFFLWPTLLSIAERIPSIALWRKDNSLKHRIVAWISRWLGMSAAMAVPTLISRCESKKQFVYCAAIIGSGVALYYLTKPYPKKSKGY